MAVSNLRFAPIGWMSSLAIFKMKRFRLSALSKGSGESQTENCLQWRMLFPAYDFQKETLPFLIEWDQSEEERYDANLVNGKNISALHYGGTSSKQFARGKLLRRRSAIMKG